MSSFRHPTSGRYTRLVTGVGHDGRSRAFAKPGEKTLAVHHSPQDARADDGGYHQSGRPANHLGSRGHAVGFVSDGKSHYPKPALDVQPMQGKPKAMHPVSLGNYNTPTQIASAGKEFAGPGLSHPSSTGGAALASSGGAVPVDPQYGTIPKSGHGPAPIAWSGTTKTMQRMGISYEQLRSLGKTLQQGAKSK
jgi:hypothetical protein